MLINEADWELLVIYFLVYGTLFALQLLYPTNIFIEIDQKMSASQRM